MSSDSTWFESLPKAGSRTTRAAPITIESAMGSEGAPVLTARPQPPAPIAGGDWFDRLSKAPAGGVAAKPEYSVPPGKMSGLSANIGGAQLPSAPSFDTTEQQAENEARGQPELRQGPPEQSIGNVLAAVPAGLYHGVATLPNLPTHAANAVGRVMAGLTSRGYNRLTPPINENPTNYLPGGAIAEGVHNASAAASNTIATGGVAGGIAPFLRAGSVPSAIATAIGQTPPSVVAGAMTGALAQKTAEDMASEPYKGIAGVGANMLAGMATAGGIAAAGNALHRPIPQDVAAMARMARDEYGLPIRAGHVTDSRAIKTLDSSLKSVPLSGHGHVDADVQEAFNRAISRQMGEDAIKVTPGVINAARERIGGVMNDIGARTSLILDNQALNNLADIYHKATLPESGLDPNQIRQVHAHIDKIVNVSAQNNGAVPGDVYQNMTRFGETLHSLQNSQSSTAANLGKDIRNTLDGMLDRSVSPEDAGALRQARAQWKVMRTIEPLTLRADTAGGASPSTGDIIPEQLRGVVNRSYDRAARAEPGEIPLHDLARIGQRLLKELRSSTTSERTNLLQQLKAAGAGAAAAVSGGHLLGTNPTIDPLTALGGAAAATGLARGASSVLRSTGYADRLIEGGLNPRPSTGEAIMRSVLPLAAGIGERELDAAGGPTINPETGLPQFNLADAQKSNAAKTVAQKLTDGSFPDHASLSAWIGENKKELRASFGGQGVQNISAVASLMRRAKSGNEDVVFHSMMKETPNPLLRHAMASAGIQSSGDLIAKIIENPDIMKEMRARVTDGKISPMTAKRIAASLHGSVASNVLRPHEDTEKRQ